MKLFKLFLIMLIILPSVSLAEFTSSHSPSKIYGAKWIKFGVDSAPADTCSYYDRHFKFDASTEGGKNILSILLAAKMSGDKVNVWYTPSTTQGQDQNGTCRINTMAVINEIGID